MSPKGTWVTVRRRGRLEESQLLDLGVANIKMAASGKAFMIAMLSGRYRDS